MGSEKVAAVLVDLFRTGRRMPDMRIEMVNCNNAPAMVAYSGDHLEGVCLVEGIDGKNTNFYTIRNPDKLVAVTVPRQISR